MATTETTRPACPGCGKPMRHEMTQMPMWLGSELKLISDVPAHICDSCDLQQFDPDTEAAVRRLVAQGFPDHRMRDRVFVPVFSLDDFRKETTQTITIPEAAR